MVLDETLRVLEVDRRDIGGDVRQLEPEPRHVVGRSLAYRPQHPGDHIPQHRHHVGVVGDEPHLGVERHVLRQVPRCVVRLGSEHWANLVDALEDSHHHLLVELRALRQKGGATEPVDREDIGPAFRGGRNDLRCVDLSEGHAIEHVAESARRGRRYGRRGPARWMSQRDCRVVEQRR